MMVFKKYPYIFQNDIRKKNTDKISLSFSSISKRVRRDAQVTTHVVGIIENFT